MTKISFITDSTAYLEKDYVANHPVRVIPLNLHWNEATYKDNVDIAADEFYNRLEKSDTLPSTSQPSAGEFLEMYKEAAKDADALVVPLISSGISGTVDSALMAAKEFKEVPVYVIDSKVTSAGLALLVKALVESAQKGSSIDDLLKLAEKIIKDMKLYFVLDTLKYLHKGGRIGGAAAFLGSALDLKPILYLTEDGKIDALEKVRTRKKAVKRLIELAEEKAGGKPAYLGIIHAQVEEEAETLQDELREKLNPSKSGIYIISPVIGTHVGPGALAVALHTIQY